MIFIIIGRRLSALYIMRGRGSADLVDVGQAAVHDLHDVDVVEAIFDFLAEFAAFDEFCASEHAQLMGDGGDAHAEDLGELGHIQIAHGEAGHDFCARGVAENLEQLGEPVDRIFIGQLIFDVLDGGLI